MRVFALQGLARLVETSKSKASRALPRIDAKKPMFRCDPARKREKMAINNNRKKNEVTKTTMV